MQKLKFTNLTKCYMISTNYEKPNVKELGLGNISFNDPQNATSFIMFFQFGLDLMACKILHVTDFLV